MFVRERFASCRGALVLGGLLVVAALVLGAAVATVSGNAGAGGPSAAPTPPEDATSAATAPASLAPAAATDPHPTPSPPPPSFPRSPAAVVTPGPARPSVAVATPAPTAGRATVRAARSGQPRQQRPLSQTATLGRTPTPSNGAPFSLSMPVPGRWQVTCGYRCGLHDGLHLYGLDLVRLDGPTAGTPVRAPVAGRIVAVTDGTTAYCGGRWLTGIAAGSVLVLEFSLPDGRSAHLRLIHLDPGSIPASLRPQDGPVAVAAGTYLGTLAYIGPGCAHLHLDLAVLQGGKEVPVPLPIAGRQLPDCGREGCWTGTVLP